LGDLGGSDRHGSPSSASRELVAAFRPSPSVMTAERREKILSLLTVGCSRRAAARFVGCSPSTISRTIVADPSFAHQVAQAEEQAEIDAVRAIRRAANNERYWRAAAWLLERKNPDEFGLRAPGCYTASNIRGILVQIVTMISSELPQEKYDRIMATIDALVVELFTPDVPPEPLFAAVIEPVGQWSPGGSASAMA
jgi:hypothetical protein